MDFQNLPVPAHSPLPSEPVLLSIGDIGISQHWVITPNGTAPLAGSRWIVQDNTITQQAIPAYAIVLAIVFFLFCLLGLLFLLIKEQRTNGYVNVSVHSGNLYHVTQLPAASPAHVHQARGLVSQAQTMAHVAGTT